MNILLEKRFLSGTSIRDVLGKNNSGMSLVALIITIIVIIILAGIGLNAYYTSTQSQAVRAKALTEFIEIENAVFQRGQENKLDDEIYALVGERLDSETNVRNINNKNYGTGYYYLTASDLLSLGVNSTTHEYVVNYITGEVIVVEPYLINGRLVFTKQDLLNEESENSVLDFAEYDEEKGVNKPIVFSGMLPVKLQGSNWVITTKDDEEWYDYTITSNGPVRMANAMLLDGVTATSPTGRYYTNEELRLMNLTEMKDFKIETPGSMFVWLPRYTYKESGGNVSIVYSKLLQDYLLEGYVKSPAFYFGEYTGGTPTDDNGGYVAGGRELSGLWISKYEARYVY